MRLNGSNLAILMTVDNTWSLNYHFIMNPDFYIGIKFIYFIHCKNLKIQLILKLDLNYFPAGRKFLNSYLKIAHTYSYGI